ncbi:MAG: radical SAM family heme chaperone HemW [Odoribacter sp.]|nr:radical SAM family heme chaperone HemW [Odoribacter sp.]
MAGIYVHIPFCRSKCFYCGFYSVASMRLKEYYLKALLREMELRKDYLPEREVATLYFGGGTPSCLDEAELEMVCDKMRGIWSIRADAECSIEVNPEDATPQKLAGFRRLGFNRITIGVQSFNDNVLKQINRTHTAEQAVRAVEMAKESGVDNIGIDLIIGLPGSDVAELKRDLRNAGDLEVDHISVYMLSVDSQSVFEKLSEKGRFQPLDDDLLAEQYLMMSDYLKGRGYEHYEISNFAKNAKYSRHNTSYWQQKPYIGLGAAAHSYDQVSRQWNVAHIRKYVDGLNNNTLYFEKEELTNLDRYNEYLMTNFRTVWGIDLPYLKSAYPAQWDGLSEKLEGYVARGLMKTDGGRIRMTERGWLLSDGIFSELFV